MEVELVEHVCATCLGRIGRRMADGAFVCTSCGATCTGYPAAICGCGISVPGLRERKQLLREDARGRLVVKTATIAVTPPRPVGFRCTPNPARGPLSPAAFVITLDAPPGERIDR